MKCFKEEMFGPQQRCHLVVGAEENLHLREFYTDNYDLGREIRGSGN